MSSPSRITRPPLWPSQRPPAGRGIHVYYTVTWGSRRVRNGELLTSYELDSDAKIISVVHFPYPPPGSPPPSSLYSSSSSPSRTTESSSGSRHEQATQDSLFTRESPMDLGTSWKPIYNSASATLRMPQNSRTFKKLKQVVIWMNMFYGKVADLSSIG